MQPSELLSGLVAALDLDDYEDVTTGDLLLTDPRTGAPTTSCITLASKEHPSRKRLDMARTRKLRASFNATGKVPVTDPVDEYDEETDYLVAATVGWNLTKGGQPLPFSAEAARALYTDQRKQWVRKQVLDALNKQELFIVSSAKP